MTERPDGAPARRRQPVNTGPFGETIANDYRPAERRAAQS
jgi:hypothetical protein